MIKLPPRIAIEPEMNFVVQQLGGTLVADLVRDRSPQFANADYWFERDNVIVELKCLSDDKTYDPQLRRALNKLFDSFIDSARIPDPGPGVFRVNSKNMPLDFQRQLYRLLARSIKRRFRKANQQIKQTRELLGRHDAYGLVLLANDGNYRLEPAQLMYAVDTALSRDFSAIEGLVVFTVNLLSTGPGIEPYASHANVWIPASRDRHRDLPDPFIERFFEAWVRHLRDLIGEKIPVLRDREHSELEHWRYDQRLCRSRRHK
jgi:hypothetical protein